MATGPRAPGTPGGYGWDGGFGTYWCSDPKRDMVALLMTQRAAFPPMSSLYREFWGTHESPKRSTRHLAGSGCVRCGVRLRPVQDSKGIRDMVAAQRHMEIAVFGLHFDLQPRIAQAEWIVRYA